MVGKWEIDHSSTTSVPSTLSSSKCVDTFLKHQPCPSIPFLNRSGQDNLNFLELPSIPLENAIMNSQIGVLSASRNCRSFDVD